MRRPAFTLVELLAATALAAMLLAAGFRVVGSLGRARAALARQDLARSYAAEAVDLLRWDLANARYMKSVPGDLTLTGYGGLDPDSLAPRHRPVTVRYHLAAAAGRNWLVREQADLDVATNRNRSSALVCSGLAGFDVWPAAGPEAVAGRTGAASPRPPPARSRPGATAQDRTGWEGPTLGLGKPEDQDDVPAAVRVVLRPERADAPAVDEWIITR
jgi:prepilin-type N-terminal cleavage/methylation domain-containing protein